MLKKVCRLLLILIVPSAVCIASPIADYSPENLLIDIRLGAPDNWSTSKLNAGYTVTAGLGFGFTGQYVYDDLQIDTPVNGTGRIKSKQINLLKKEGKRLGGISFLIGSSQSELIGSPSQTGILAGLQGTAKIAPNTHAYATVTAGNIIVGYEVGIGYNLTPNTELRLDYRDVRYRGLISEDITVKVPLGGIVYRF